MACFHPLKGWKNKHTGGFTSQLGDAELAERDGEPDPFNPVSLDVPCGQCIGCRIRRSKEWAIRITHEASLHQDNQFLTLTYAPVHLPRSGSLQLAHFQRFMKRYRKWLGKELRYFMCGEYGEKLSRPHYHAAIFGHRFGDLELVNERDGFRLYTSPNLERLWGHGFVTIGELTPESAAYIARYVTKKITGKAAGDHYQTIDPGTGEIFRVRPEFVTMSRRPGIASEWFKMFREDVYPDDFIIHKGKRYPTPRYYDKLLEAEYPQDLECIKEKRKAFADAHVLENTPERLAVRKECLKAKLTRLNRGYENATQDVQRV